MQDVRQPRQQLQVAAHGGTDQREEHVHGLAVQGPEVHGPFQEPQGDHRPVHVQNDRIAHVRQGDAAPDRRGRGCFPGQEKTQQQFAVDPFGQG